MTLLIFTFNDGAHGISNVLEQFSIKYRIYAYIGLSKKDEISIRWSSTKCSEAGEKTYTTMWYQKKVSFTKQ